MTERDQADQRALMNRRVLIVTSLAAVGIGMAASIFATPFGLGVTPDSLLYLHAADSLRQGLGFRVPADDGSLVPLTHYPPLFPATLALASSVGLDLLSAARAVSLVLTAANILAVTVATHAFTRSAGAAAAAAFVIALSVDMLFLNTAIWSDGEFIFLAIVCLALVTTYLHGRGRRYLVLGALAGALSWLSRWVGGAVVVAAAAGILLLGQGRAVRKLTEGMLFILIASAPPLAWMSYNATVAGTATNRTIELSPLSMDHAVALVQTMSSWLLPATNRIYVFAGQDMVVTICGTTAVLALVALAHRFVVPTLASRTALVRTPILFLVFMFVYVAALLAATSMFDSSMPLDNRMLAPAYVALVIVAAFILHAAFRATRRYAWRVAGVGVLTAFLLVNAGVTIGAGTLFRREGRGFVGPAWQYPVLQRALAEVGPLTPLYSNHPGGVEFALGKRAQAASEDTLARGIAGGGVVVLVYFDDPRSYAPRNAEADKMAPSTAEDRVKLLRGLPATLVAHERNGWVYRLTSSSDQGGVAPTR